MEGLVLRLAVVKTGKSFSHVFQIHLRAVCLGVHYSNFALQYLAVFKLPSVKVSISIEDCSLTSNDGRSSMQLMDLGNYSRNCLHKRYRFQCRILRDGIWLGSLLSVSIVDSL